jgi:lipoyl(octanoyl) transferase
MKFITHSGYVDYPTICAYMEAHISTVTSPDHEEIHFLQHPSIYTRGVRARETDLLSNDLPIYDTPRGGQFTYHGPGQLIIYPLMNLNFRQRDVKKYIESLELWMIKTLESFGVQAFVCKDRVGVWINHNGQEKKIAAIGVKLRKWVTYHGMSLNISPDLKFFDGIVPCGLKDYGVTSLLDLGIDCSLDDVIDVMKKLYPQIEFFNDLIKTS